VGKEEFMNSKIRAIYWALKEHHLYISVKYHSVKHKFKDSNINAANNNYNFKVLLYF